MHTMRFITNLRTISFSFIIVSKYRTRVTPVLRRELATAYVRTGEAVATANVLGQMVINNQETGNSLSIRFRQNCIFVI